MGDDLPVRLNTTKGVVVEENSKSPLQYETSNRLHPNMQPSGPPVAVAHPVHQPSGIAHRQRTSGPAVTNAHGPRLPNLNMGSTTSPPYHRTHAMAFDHQRNMSQHYLQTAQSQGIMYHIPPLVPFAGHLDGNNPAYSIPAYSQAYPGYMQHLQHLQHQQHQQHQQQQQQTTHLSHGPPDSYHQMYMQGTGPQLGHIVTDQSTMYTQPYYHQLPYHHMQLAHGQQAMRMQVSSQPALDYRSIQNLSPSPSRSMGAGDNGKRRPLPSTHEFSAVIVDGSTPMRSARPQAQVQVSPPKQSIPAVTPSTPRGPPRKPKQSGHALWVGNLPPSANVVDLKDHFSRDATNDIESVFLISKSNCAFVNYKTEEACGVALARFHDSMFQGVRLVCRSRRGLTTPGPSASHWGTTGGSSSFEEAKDTLDTPAESSESQMTRQTNPEEIRHLGDTRFSERYFIVKSLTVEDLELSRQSGIWATQTHNEDVLNRAYESAGDVYLIFSANKSGEYFGYARMISPINEDENLALEMPPRPDRPVTESEDIEVVITEATSTAPRGRILDDSARGTIFWEAESSEDDEDDDDAKSERSFEETTVAAAASTTTDNAQCPVGQSFGKPFRIEWLSTERVPFYRTRGLRNPWNANREVKIARDGTELEPTVGRKLVQLFHTPPPPPPPPTGGLALSAYQPSDGNYQ